VPRRHEWRANAALCAFAVCAAPPLRVLRAAVGTPPTGPQQSVRHSCSRRTPAHPFTHMRRALRCPRPRPSGASLPFFCAAPSPFGAIGPFCHTIPRLAALHCGGAMAGAGRDGGTQQRSKADTCASMTRSTPLEDGAKQKSGSTQWHRRRVATQREARAEGGKPRRTTGVMDS
jgi:hypothetical protein